MSCDPRMKRTNEARHRHAIGIALPETLDHLLQLLERPRSPPISSIISSDLLELLDGLWQSLHTRL